ncbi:cupin domain-containing protein [Thiohalocapsa marina]|uniref:Cupin domain-containing protein n=1 Tax=Thiohalocapsa marina TaxID=424902 RepID=A0A5M8FS28_9GAMM|nr:cupin domain-containing protein [Thiohalocapsa marina]
MDRPPPATARRGVANLFEALPSPETGECFDQLLHCRNLRVERIVSSAQPEPTWYDQTQDEWVLLLCGHATLQVGDERLELGAGDYTFLPAHTRHRVIATSAQPPCVWLAIHLDPAD